MNLNLYSIKSPEPLIMDVRGGGEKLLVAAHDGFQVSFRYRARVCNRRVFPVDFT
jgi:hypothetical protein